MPSAARSMLEVALEEALPFIISSGKLWAEGAFGSVCLRRFSALGVACVPQGGLSCRKGSNSLKQRKLDETAIADTSFTSPPGLGLLSSPRQRTRPSMPLPQRATESYVGFVRDIAEGNLLLALTHLAEGKV